MMRKSAPFLDVRACSGRRKNSLPYFFLVLRLLLLAVGTVPRSTDFATIHFTPTISMTYFHNSFFQFYLRTCLQIN